MIQFVMDHYQSKIVLAKVAALVGMSEGHFSRFFHKATGSSFSEFVNRVRITRACDVLSRTNRPITLIAGEAGFNNIANFNRRFVQYKHMTPSKYRQQSRERYCAMNTSPSL